jgi:hypothetical protein
MKRLKKGDRIRLKVMTLSGWKGFGTVIEDQSLFSESIRFRKDSTPPWTAEGAIGCGAMRHEVSRVACKQISILVMEDM